MDRQHTITFVTVAGERVEVRAVEREHGLLWLTAPRLSDRPEMGPFGDELDARAFVFPLVERMVGLVREIVSDA